MAGLYEALNNFTQRQDEASAADTQEPQAELRNEDPQIPKLDADMTVEEMRSELIVQLVYSFIESHGNNDYQVLSAEEATRRLAKMKKKITRALHPDLNPKTNAYRLMPEFTTFIIMYENAIEKIVELLHSEIEKGNSLEPQLISKLVYSKVLGQEDSLEQKRRKEREGRAVDAIRENLMSRISRKERFSIGDTINNLVYDFYPLKEGGYSCLIYDRKQNDEDGLIPRIGDTTTDDPLSLLSERNVSLSDISIQDLEPEEEESEAPYQEQLIGEVKNLLNQGSYFSIRQESGDVIQVFPGRGETTWYIKADNGVEIYQEIDEAISALNIQSGSVIQSTSFPFVEGIRQTIDTYPSGTLEIQLYPIYPDKSAHETNSLIRNNGKWTMYTGGQEYIIPDIDAFLKESRSFMYFADGFRIIDNTIERLKRSAKRKINS